MTPNPSALELKLLDAENLLSDVFSMLSDEEDSVREEHADLLNRLDAYFSKNVDASVPAIHEYAFDCILNAAIRVKATTEVEARGILRGAIDSSSANLGAWPNGDPILCEVSFQEVVGGGPYEIDGEEV